VRVVGTQRSPGQQMDTAPHNPRPDRGPGSPADPQPQGPPEQPSEASLPPATAPPTPAASPVDSDQAPQAGPARRDLSGQIRQLVHGRMGLWALVAALLVIAGTVGSVLGARAVGRHHAARARQDFQASSTSIASSLKLTVQHEEDLTVSASTYFAANPRASHGEFEAWAKWAQMLRHYPELDGLGLIAYVRANELAAFETAVTGHAVQASPPRSGVPVPSSAALRIVPAGERPYYCLMVAGLTRSPAARAPAGLDYCAIEPGLPASRDNGHSSYAAASVGHVHALGAMTPVYRGAVPPATVSGRRAAFVGWLRKVLDPSVVAQRALLGHSESAVRLRYRTGSSAVVVASGGVQSDAQSTRVRLHNGWAARIYGPPADAGIFAPGNGGAVAVLVGGMLLSVLIGLLVFVLGSARPRPRAPKPRELPPEDLYDPLTGLPNRALTLDLAERMVARVGRKPGMLAGALLIDIDWFKDVNEKLGRDAGDQLLRIVAERLANVVRGGDTVGRLEGDQFVVLVEAEARGARLDSLARRVIEALHEPVALPDFGPSFFLTVSIGVAFGRHASPGDLLRDSRLALQASKSAGKDRYTLFNANMRSVIEDRGVLEADLNTALAERQFFLLYQPIYDLRTRGVVGMEAVIRWLHPKQGVLAPSDFIPIAEETGLIVPIGRWVLEEACSRAAAWNVAGHHVGVSVQVAANQLNRDGFVTDLRRALQQSGIAPSLLTLEVAETTVMSDVDAAAERLAEIKQLGIRIAIDDFGSGYAYRADLQRLPLDFLKVDRSSLAASDDEDYRNWLLEAILVFGRDLSLTVIAKGIDTEEHMGTVQAMGCTMAQGFFLGQPTPANAVEGVLAGEHPTVQAAPGGEPQ
jgi:diguanylate cyclase (GGDEF)-like protein